jgi:hypothetical protein
VVVPTFNNSRVGNASVERFNARNPFTPTTANPSPRPVADESTKISVRTDIVVVPAAPPPCVPTYAGAAPNVTVATPAPATPPNPSPRTSKLPLFTAAPNADNDKFTPPVPEADNVSTPPPSAGSNDPDASETAPATEPRISISPPCGLNDVANAVAA